ncbi:MAG: PDC sensor domain-containing protein, partial [Planctomycetota bacterium]
MLLAVGCKSRKNTEPEPSGTRLDATPAQAAFVAGVVDATLLEALAACHDLAAHKFVREYYEEEGRYPPRHRVLTTLRRTISRLDASAAFLVEEDGMVVASTEQVAVNQQFGDWFSFSNAMTADGLVLPTISVAKRRRAFVISVPVLKKDGSTTGVVVIAHDGSIVEPDLEMYPAPTAFVFRDRYAIATNRLGRRLEALAAVPPSGESTAFKGNLLKLLDGLVPIGDRVTVDGQ